MEAGPPFQVRPGAASAPPAAAGVRSGLPSTRSGGGWDDCACKPTSRPGTAWAGGRRGRHAPEAAGRQTRPRAAADGSDPVRPASLAGPVRPALVSIRRVGLGEGRPSPWSWGVPPRYAAGVGRNDQRRADDRHGGDARGLVRRREALNRRATGTPPVRTLSSIWTAGQVFVPARTSTPSARSRRTASSGSPRDPLASPWPSSSARRDGGGRGVLPGPPRRRPETGRRNGRSGSSPPTARPTTPAAGSQAPPFAVGGPRRHPSPPAHRPRRRGGRRDAAGDRPVPPHRETGTGENRAQTPGLAGGSPCWPYS